MKRVLCLICMSLILPALGGCAGSTTGPDTSRELNPPSATTYETLQPNGMKITLQSSEAEYFDWAYDENGYTVVKEDGEYRYALLAEDGELEATHLVVGEDNPQSAGLMPHAIPSEKILKRIEEENAQTPRNDFLEPIDESELPDGHMIIDGDIAMVADSADERTAAGTYGYCTPWPDGIVYYSFDANVSSTNRSRARAAMDEWESLANVQFIPRTTQYHHIHIFSGSGNWSYVGRVGGQQLLSIYNWTYKYIICHELAHALGVWHEQSRNDRDTYVTIQFQNIQSGMEHNFSKLSLASMSGDYDFDSIMHYPRWAFSRNGQDTITCRAPHTHWQNSIGQRSHLSVGDAATMIALYGSNAPTATPAYFATDESTAVSGTLEATDSGGVTLTYSIVTNGTYGTAVVTDADAGTFTYTPNPGSNGHEDTFTFRASSEHGASQPAAVTIAIFGDAIWPAPDSVIDDPSQRFYWNPIEGAIEYRLSVGSSLNGTDIFDQTITESLSVSATGIEGDGNTVYVRLGANVGGNYQYTNYTYGTHLRCSQDTAYLVSHSDGDTLDGTSVEFEWCELANVDEYKIRWGYEPTASDKLYNQSQGQDHTATLSGFPDDGRTVYLRLWSRYEGDTYFRASDYQFTSTTSPDEEEEEEGGEEEGEGGGGAEACSGNTAQLTSHSDGDTLDSDTVTFEWCALANADEYKIRWGYLPEARDKIYNESQGTSESATLSSLPTDGSTIYLRLWSRQQGDTYFRASDYRFTSHTGGGEEEEEEEGEGEGEEEGGGEENACSGDTARLTSHSDGDTLDSDTVTFEWCALANADEYKIRWGYLPEARDKIYNESQGTSESATLSNLPTDGSTIYLRLWSRQQGDAYFRASDYQFTSHTGDGEEEGGEEEGGENACSGNTAQLTSHSNGDTLDGDTVTFEWCSLANVDEYKIRWGYLTEARDKIYNESQGTSESATLSNLPTDGSTIYLRLWSRQQGDTYFRASDYQFTSDNSSDGGEEEGEEGEGIGAPACVGDTAYLTSHSSGDTLNGESDTLEWCSLANVDEYKIRWGYLPTARDKIYNQSQGTNESVLLDNLPTDGRIIYLRLWSRQAGDQQFRNSDYLFRTHNSSDGGESEEEGDSCVGNAPYLMSHENHDVLEGDAVNLQWCLLDDVAEYKIRWGYLPTASDKIYNQSQGTNTETTLENLPTDGRTVYLRLWYRQTDEVIFRKVDYQFTAHTTGQ